jgi:hypothetical protein
MTYQALVQSKAHLKAYSKYESTAGQQYPLVEYFGSGVSGSVITTRTGTVTAVPIPRLSGSPDNRANSLTYSIEGRPPDWYRLSTGTMSSYAFEFWGNANTNTNPNLFSDTNQIMYDFQGTETITTSVRSSKGYIRTNDLAFAIRTSGTEILYTMPYAPPQNEWVHYVFEVENTTSFSGGRVYVNGVKVFEQAQANPNPITYYFLYGGQSTIADNTSWTRGYLISDVAVWGNNTNQRAVTDADIAERYAYGSRTKYFNGTTWAKPISENYWNGTAWVNWDSVATTKTWNGTGWVNI